MVRETDKKNQAKKSEKKKKKLTPEEKEKERKKEEIVIPAIMFIAIIIVIAALVYCSMKSGDAQKIEDQRIMCSRQLTVRIAPVLAAYQKEKGDYPGTLDDLKSFLASTENTDSSSGTPSPAGTAAPSPPLSPSPSEPALPSPGTSVDKKLVDIWQNFYCPADHDKQTFSYTYEKPPSEAAESFIVMKCRVHGEKSVLKLEDVKRFEASEK
jgi:hypothetical protein